jgi:hypothetical protein
VEDVSASWRRLKFYYTFDVLSKSFASVEALQINALEDSPGQNSLVEVVQFLDRVVCFWLSSFGVISIASLMSLASLPDRRVATAALEIRHECQNASPTRLDRSRSYPPYLTLKNIVHLFRPSVIRLTSIWNSVVRVVHFAKLRTKILEEIKEPKRYVNSKPPDADMVVVDQDRLL